MIPILLACACGHCDSCLLRKKGFAEAGVPDPTLRYQNEASLAMDHRQACANLQERGQPQFFIFLSSSSRLPTWTVRFTTLPPLSTRNRFGRTITPYCVASGLSSAPGWNN